MSPCTPQHTQGYINDHPKQFKRWTPSQHTVPYDLRDNPQGEVRYCMGSHCYAQFYRLSDNGTFGYYKVLKGGAGATNPSVELQFPNSKSHTVDHISVPQIRERAIKGNELGKGRIHFTRRDRTWNEDNHIWYDKLEKTNKRLKMLKKFLVNLKKYQSHANHAMAAEKLMQNEHSKKREQVEQVVSLSHEQWKLAAASTSKDAGCSKNPNQTRSCKVPVMSNKELHNWRKQEMEATRKQKQANQRQKEENQKQTEAAKKKQTEAAEERRRDKAARELQAKKDEAMIAGWNKNLNGGGKGSSSNSSKQTSKKKKKKLKR